MDVVGLQIRLGVTADGIFGPRSRAALLARFTNLAAPRLTDDDIAALASRWDVPATHIKGVRQVEAPRGPYDALGRPTLLYERHKFRSHTTPPRRFDASHPVLSGRPYGPGGYGPYSGQIDRLAAACALDPGAAFKACSWGSFQVLGENAVVLGYDSAFDMAESLVTGEASHLETFARFVETYRLVDAFRDCRPNDPASCVPFVKRYNGAGYASFGYDKKLAVAIAQE